MFDNIKKGLAKAAPWFCYVEEVQPSNVVSFEDLKKEREAQIAAEEKEARNTATTKFVSVDKNDPIPEGYVLHPDKTVWELEDGEEVPEGFQRINDHECVQIDPDAVDPHSFKGFVKDVTKKAKDAAKFIGKIFVEVVPVNEETPLDLVSQAADAAVTSATNAIFVGATTMFTAKFALPIRLVSGAVAAFTATQVAQMMKDSMVHPKVEEYKGYLVDTLAISRMSPEISMALVNATNDDLTIDERRKAQDTIINTAWPNVDDQNRWFVECNGNVDTMTVIAGQRIIGESLAQNKFYTEFLNKPFVEQKWFVKAKNWFKGMKETFTGFPKFLAEGAPVMAMIIAANAVIANFALAKGNTSNKEVIANA